MQKLILYEYLTVDGIAESPEKWQFPYYSQDVAEFNVSRILTADYLLLGRKTYDIFAAFWPLQRNNEFGIADKFNAVPKFVVSSTLRETTWANTTIIRDAVQEIGELKRRPGSHIAVPGSIELARFLIAHGLVDEIHLLVHPIIVGSGKRLFGSDNRTKPMKLLDSRTFSSGVVFLSYRPDNQGG
jgi:dihydrofolate reductase